MSPAQIAGYVMFAVAVPALIVLAVDMVRLHRKIVEETRPRRWMGCPSDCENCKASQRAAAMRLAMHAHPNWNDWSPSGMHGLPTLGRWMELHGFDENWEPEAAEAAR